MKGQTRTDRVRVVLRCSETGLTADEIAERLSTSLNLTRVMLSQMPDTYIERWERTEAGRGFKAVWKVAHVPPNAPRPELPVEELRDYDKKCRERRKNEKAKEPAPASTPKTQWVTPPPWAN